MTTVNGLDVRLPVYLNLAPNYDATLTPRWLSKRGLMTQGEFRYLTEHSQRPVQRHLAAERRSDRRTTEAC